MARLGRSVGLRVDAVHPRRLDERGEDGVMRAENGDDKDVYNGDLGFITRIDPDAAEVMIDFEGREVTYDYGELDELVPAYATAVPEAQDSEYRAVVIPLVTQHYAMLPRKPVDTAVTRGKKLVVVVAQPKALALAVRGRSTGSGQAPSQERTFALLSTTA